jgi:hypothetical protein
MVEPPLAQRDRGKTLATLPQQRLKRVSSRSSRLKHEWAHIVSPRVVSAAPPCAPGQWRRFFFLRRARLRWVPSMPPISRKKAMKRFGGIFSRPAISSAAAHFAAAFPASLGKAERIRTSGRSDLGACEFGRASKDSA